jgi:hypothetical protein
MKLHMMYTCNTGMHITVTVKVQFMKNTQHSSQSILKYSIYLFLYTQKDIVCMYMCTHVLTQLKCILTFLPFVRTVPLHT